MKVRLAQLEDLSKIIAIEKICFPIAEAATEKQFHERFESFGDCFLVAEDHGVVVGFINGCATSQPYLPMNFIMMLHYIFLEVPIKLFLD